MPEQSKANALLADQTLPGVQGCRTCRDLPSNLLRFVSTADLVADTYKLAAQLPPKGPITIITGRSDKHRAGSLAWCHHHGVKAKQLVMFPGDTPKDYSLVAQYKGEQVKKLGLAYFVESSPSQSKIITKVSGRPTITPKARRVFV